MSAERLSDLPIGLVIQIIGVFARQRIVQADALLMISAN
jgi:hypothetical protein